MSEKNNKDILQDLNDRRSKAQKGGGDKKTYGYIVNPKTNRKVNIYGKTGQKVLRSYINYMR